MPEETINIDTMTPTQALAILNSATATFQGDRNAHTAIIKALEVLKASLQNVTQAEESKTEGKNGATKDTLKVLTPNS